MASKTEIRKSLAELKKWYPKTIPPKVLADRIDVTEEEAIGLLKEFSGPPKPPAVRRKKVSKGVDLVHSVAQHVLPFGAGIIAIIALGRSVLFTFNYFSRTDSFYSAVFMAILFGMVGYLAPSITMLAYKSRRWFIGIGALLAFLLFGWINIYITVQELNITKIEKELVVTDNQEEIIKARKRVEQITIDISALQSSIGTDKREYGVVLAKSAEPEITTNEYNRHRNNLGVINERIAEKENSILLLRNEETLLTSLDGYYTMVIVTEGDKQEARRMDAVFAISLEVIGPLFTAIALFL